MTDRTQCVVKREVANKPLEIPNDARQGDQLDDVTDRPFATRERPPTQYHLRPRSLRNYLTLLTLIFVLTEEQHTHTHCEGG